MKRLVIILLCLLAVGVCADRRGQLLQQRNPSATSWTDPSGSNTMYAWWVSSDKTVSGAMFIGDTNPWTDRVQGILLRQNGSTVSNDIYGMTFIGVAGRYLTNAPLAAGTNATVCVILRQNGAPSGTHLVYSPYDGSDTTQGTTPGGVMLDNGCCFYWQTKFTGGSAISGTLAASTRYDLILSQTNGTLLVYTNGLQSASLSKLPPAGGWPWRYVGADGLSAIAPFDGWITEVMVWSNSFSSIQLSNVHYYATNTYSYAP